MKHGNKLVTTTKTPTGFDENKEALSSENQLFYLPKGKTELEIF
jgi:hypothetical protein